MSGILGGCLRMSAADKEIGKGFPDRMDGEEIIPQFEVAECRTFPPFPRHIDHHHSKLRQPDFLPTRQAGN